VDKQLPAQLTTTPNSPQHPMLEPNQAYNQDHTVNANVERNLFFLYII
jgi:hypothetical protein